MAFSPVYMVGIYFCDMTTGKRRTNQIREAPAQPPRLFMFSSAHTEAHQQCTFITVHNAELSGNRVSSAGLPLLVGGLHTPYFLGSQFPHSTQTRNCPQAQSQVFHILPSFSCVPVLQHLDKFLLIKGNRGFFWLKSRLKPKQQHNSNAQGITAEP